MNQAAKQSAASGGRCGTGSGQLFLDMSSNSLQPVAITPGRGKWGQRIVIKVLEGVAEATAQVKVFRGIVGSLGAA